MGAFLKRVFIENAGTWLMSLVLATIVWSYLYNDSTDVQEVDADVIVEGADPNETASWTLRDVEGGTIDHWVAFGDRPSVPRRKLRVRLSGAKGTLQTMQGRAVIVKLSLKGLSHGMNTVHLEHAHSNLPPEIKIQYLPSPTVLMEVKRFKSREVTLLVPDPTREPAAGHEVVRWSATEKVQALLPEGEVDKIPCKPVSVEGKVESFTTLLEPDAGFPVKFLGQAEMRVEIAPRMKRVTLHDVPVHLAGEPRTGWEVTLGPPKTCKVVVQMDQSRELKPEEIFLYVHLDRQDEGDWQVRVECKVRVPEDQRGKYQVLKIEPESIGVKAKKVK